MKEAIRKVGDALLSFGGFAFTIICGAVGCLNLPPAFSNWWRFAIFVGLLTCYVIGFLSGMKKKALEADEELAKTRGELGCQIVALENRIAVKDRQIEGTRAAIARHKEREAELARRWDEARSRERELRKAFDGLLPRERSCLAMVLDVVYSGHVFSARGELNFATLDALVRAGFVERLNEFGDGRVAYTPRLDARGWLFDHRCELPEYGSGEYTLDGGELNRSLYHPLVEFPGAEPSGRDGEVAG